MRTTFVETLTEMAARDHRVMLVVGDLGFGVVTDFARRFPRQFLNVGVAEQNMAGVAAGLAMAGKIVFTYSIGNFPTLRCLEQIRNDICYHDANVIVVSVGGGFSYGALGMTHHATEDIAIMRAIPGMKVIAPGDPLETVAATRAVAEGIGPVYLRLGRAGEPVVHRGHLDWTLGKGVTVREGKDLTLISTGAMLATTVTVAESLARDGFQARVLSMHTISPLDDEAVLSAARESGMIFTIEEHSIVGGLGGAVSEVLAESNLPQVSFRRFGVPSTFGKEVGSQDYLRALFGLDAESIGQNILSILRRRSAGRPGTAAAA